MDNKRELERNASSFPGLIPPNGAKLEWKREKNGDIYNFYLDKAGNVYYDTESGRRFEREMKESQKKKVDRRVATSSTFSRLSI